MEYIEYYRIIRERVWLAILGAALAGLAFIGWRVVQPESHSASGQVSVNEIASRSIVAHGDQVEIGMRGEFWSNFVQRGTGPAAMRNILRELNLPLSAEQQYRINISASRIGNSNYISFRCESSESEVSVQVADAGMEMWDEEWKRYKIAEAERAVELLEERLPVVQDELDEAKAEVEEIEQRHGGLSPQEEVQALSTSLATTRAAMRDASLESVAAGKRAEILAAAPRRRPEEPPVAQELAIVERLDTVEQQLMARQAELEEMLKRRTRNHPDVQALEREISALESRIDRLEQAAEEAGGTSEYLREAVITARTYAEEMAARRELLAEREAELRDKLAQARTDMLQYEKLVADLEAVRQRYLQIKENIRSAKAELLARQNLEHMITIESPAELDVARAGAIGPPGFRRTAMMFVMVALAGAGLGILAIFVLHYIDTTFKNEEEAARLLGYPVFGAIPRTDIEVISEAEAGGYEEPSGKPLPE